MGEQDKPELQRMWREEPDRVRTTFPGGVYYLVEEGENLKKLGEAFGMPWEHIAEATMGSSEPKKINQWLSDNGGRKLPSGYWAFTPGQKILIPAPKDTASI